MDRKDSLSSHSAEFEKAGTHAAFSQEESATLEKRVWRKLDWYILPVVTMFYLLSWLDRTNLGNARVAGIQQDLRMNNKQYSIALTVTFVPYIVSEIPSNLLLKIVGPNLLLPALIVSWGIVTTFQGFVSTYGGLLACRFFIGLLEGGVLPGLVLYLSMFYPRRKLQSRISAFFSSASLSGAFSGLLATAIMKMHGMGGRPAWAWIFILEGLFTVVFGFMSVFVLPKAPQHTRFLSQREKEYVISELRQAGAISTDDKNDGFSWAEVRRTFSRPQFWFLGFVYFFNGTMLYSLAYFTPSIVQALGYTPIRTQLMTVGPYGAAFVLTNVASVIADRYQCRGFVAIFSSLCCLAGFAIYKTSTDKATLYGSLFLTIGGINCSSPALAAWVANNFAPHVRRATAIAALSMITNSGGILSTWLMASWSKPPRYTSATIVFLVFAAMMGIFTAFNLAYLYYANKAKALQRESTTQSEESPDLGDKSAWYPYIL
ncbi:unnamed protein product [Cyclocybe aegerita]|uniref:Major facilitator superfamily (MFS) profile domain-containing protein n=1 Tax=Cyclocybe aegerita TaxID=1973307 RepID=A0A8S0WCR4_CYCAE|nr:unnamed protein product [Cyclocybe aegerita]